MEEIADNGIRHAHEVLDENRQIYRQKLQDFEAVLQEKDAEVSNLKYNEGTLKFEASNLAKENERLLSQIADLSEVERLAKELLSKQ